MLVEGIFHLDGRDVLAAGDDHVLLAVDDAGIALLVHDADVAGLQETVGRHDLGGFVRSVPVARHDLGPTDADLAGLPEGHFVALVVADGHFGGGNRQADGARELREVEPVAGDHRRGFGQAVPFDHRAAGDLEPLLGRGLLHGHAAADAMSEGDEAIHTQALAH